MTVTATRPARIVEGDGDPRHGTVNGYKNLRCRCPGCRDANRIYGNAYTWGLPALRHVDSNTWRLRHVAEVLDRVLSGRGSTRLDWAAVARIVEEHDDGWLIVVAGQPCHTRDPHWAYAAPLSVTVPIPARERGTQ